MASNDQLIIYEHCDCVYEKVALAFYVPANLLPVMNTTLPGSGADSTIMSGSTHA